MLSEYLTIAKNMYSAGAVIIGVFVVAALAAHFSYPKPKE